MGSLLTSLLNTSTALRAFSQGLQVVQNNVSNSSTPGYAKQIQTFQALPDDVSVGLPGGVVAGPVQSARDGFAERNVQDHQSALGLFQSKASALSGLEPTFNLSIKSGLSPSVNALFQSFAGLSVNPSNATARQGVIDQAGQVSQAFHTVAAGLASASDNIGRETRGTISEINRLAGTISEINANRKQDGTGAVDPGLDAQLNSSLEELSQYTDFTALQQPDGNVNVYIGGQSPLVIGSQSFAIQGDFSTSKTKILDYRQNDITGQLSQGKLRGELDFNNVSLPPYTADLNTLARSLADQVNSTLASGVDANGAAPAVGLFTYNAAKGAAATLNVTDITPDQIAAAIPSAPGGNENALNLAALADGKTVNGSTFTEFFGSLAGRVGRDLSDSKDAQSTQQDLLVQAQSVRQQSSGVSLDEEATRLVEFQRSYQAASKLVTVLNDLTQTTIDMIR